MRRDGPRVPQGLSTTDQRCRDFVIGLRKAVEHEPLFRLVVWQADIGCVGPCLQSLVVRRFASKRTPRLVEDVSCLSVELAGRRTGKSTREKA